MCMIGKGIGQDATLRPKTDSVAVARIKNKENTLHRPCRKEWTIIKQIALGKHQKLLGLTDWRSNIFRRSQERKAKAELIWFPNERFTKKEINLNLWPGKMRGS